MVKKSERNYQKNKNRKEIYFALTATDSHRKLKSIWQRNTNSWSISYGAVLKIVLSYYSLPAALHFALMYISVCVCKRVVIYAGSRRSFASNIQLKMSVQKADFEQDKVYLYQFTRAKCIPSMSPFCLKVETWLRMADLNYEVHWFWFSSGFTIFVFIHKVF